MKEHTQVISPVAVSVCKPERLSDKHLVTRRISRVGNASSEIFRVFAFDKFVMLALYDHDRHA